MTQKKTRGTLAFFLIPFSMVTILMIMGGASVGIPHAVGKDSQHVTEMKTEAKKQVTETGPVTAVGKPNVVVSEDLSVEELPTNPWHDYPNACETFTVIEGARLVKTKKGRKRYPIRYRRNRFKRKRSDQRRTRDLIKMVVREMGGDDAAQRVVSMIAMHESSWNPEAIHILNPDLSANQNAWSRRTYLRSTEVALEEKLSKASARSKRFWDLKAQLHDIRLYKGNPHWNDELEYTHRVPERNYRGEAIPAFEWNDHRSVWAFGYGLYGMNAVLFTHIWDREAPPWVLCGDEGIEATIAAVWVLRRSQVECASLSRQDPEKWGSEGSTARGLVRRFARGRCSDKRLGPAWRRLMAARDEVDWDSSPNFGKKFQRYETYMHRGKRRLRKEDGKKVRADRAPILAHMLAKAGEKGLLREEPLERKVVGSEPVVAKPVAVAKGAPFNN